MMDELTQRLKVKVNNVDDEKRILSFTFSSNTSDRKGDTVNNSGWIIDDFIKNPVFLWQHNITEQPLGRIHNLRTEGVNLVGEVEFWKSNRDPALWSEFDKKADSVYEQYKSGYMKGASVRFKPVDISSGTTKEGGIKYNKQYLLEISAVSVPDHADALVSEYNKKQTTPKNYNKR